MTILENSPAVLDLLPAASVYGLRVPESATWPFIRWGTSDAGRFIATGHNGLEDEIMVHCFSDHLDESEATLINGAISHALDYAAVDLDAPYPARCTFTAVGSRVIPDAAEADKWHGIVRVRWACVTT